MVFKYYINLNIKSKFHNFVVKKSRQKIVGLLANDSHFKLTCGSTYAVIGHLSTLNFKITVY